MLKKAKRWLRERDLPRSGWVLFFGGNPFAWERDSPDPLRVIPGVVAVSMLNGAKMVANGGSVWTGALEWRCC